APPGLPPARGGRPVPRRASRCARRGSIRHGRSAYSWKRFYNVERDSTIPMKTIQSVDRAVRILKALGEHPGRLGLSDLAERVGLAKTTVHGLLRTLQEHGLVEQHLDTDKYQLGPELLQLGNSYLDLNELRSRSLAWSELLSTRVGEAVRVAVPHGAGVLVVHHVFRPDSSLQLLEVGALLPLHATGLGKALLAYAGSDYVDDVVATALPKLTGHTHVTATAIRRELGKVRDVG